MHIRGELIAGNIMEHKARERAKRILFTRRIVITALKRKESGAKRMYRGDIADTRAQYHVHNAAVSGI